MTSKRLMRVGILFVGLSLAWVSVTRIAVARTIAPPHASVMGILHIAANGQYAIAAPHQSFPGLFRLPVVYAQATFCSAHCDKGLGQTGYEPQSTVTPGCFSNNCPGCTGPCSTYTCHFTGSDRTCQQWSVTGINNPCAGCTNADSCKP